MAAWSALEERALWHDDGRLSTPQDDHVVCGHEPPGRDRDRCLHAPTHSQRVDPVLAVNRSADPTGQTTPPHFGQLFRPQNPEIKLWLARHPRFHFHFVPTSSSWLNIVERFFRDLTVKRIRRGIITSGTW